MATKILGGIGSLLGIGKKKAEPAPAAPEAKKGPIITQLPGAPTISTPLAARRRTGRATAPSPTILADKLGSY